MYINLIVPPTELRPRGAADDVREQDGAHVGQGPLLRVRPRVLGQGDHRPEGAHHGAQLPAWQERGTILTLVTEL